MPDEPLTAERPDVVRPVYASPELTEANPDGDNPYLHTNWDMDFGANLTFSATDDPQRFQICLSISDHVKANGIMLRTAAKGQVFDWMRMLGTVIGGKPSEALAALEAELANAKAEVTRLTALITAPDGGGIPLPLLDELQASAAESGCHHRDAIDVAAGTGYSVGSEHTEDLTRELADAKRSLVELEPLSARAEADKLRAQRDEAWAWLPYEMRCTLTAKWAEQADTVPAAPVPAPADEPGSLLDDFPELANARVTFDPRRNTAPHTARGPKASDPDREHPAHDGQTCEEYDAAPVVAEATQAESCCHRPAGTCHWNGCSAPRAAGSKLACPEHVEAAARLKAKYDAESADATPDAAPDDVPAAADGGAA